MRDFKGMKRQRGRNRNKAGANNANNANPNRSWDSQGPENIKVRGNAQTVYERYMQLARDASAGGDRVLAENYTQHAEHYFRVLRALQPSRPVSEIAQRELAGQGFDIDFEDETGAGAEAFAAISSKARISIEWLHRSSRSEGTTSPLAERTKAAIDSMEAGTFVWFAAEKSVMRNVKTYLAARGHDRKRQYAAWYWEEGKHADD